MFIHSVKLFGQSDAGNGMGFRIWVLELLYKHGVGLGLIVARLRTKRENKTMENRDMVLYTRVETK
jgi:hypothetical protein